MKTKIILLAFVLAFGGIAQAQIYIAFEEDFEGLTLGPNVDEAAGVEVWTDTPPDGWVIDESGVPGAGDPANDGVTEWAGWAFTDKQWWIGVAGNQRRSEFDLGQGTVAVADPDEWDDADHPSGSYNTFLTTPEINISGTPAGTVQLKFDSSWRPDSPQTAVITVQYDGGDAIEILRWESDAGPFFKDDNSTNETIILNLDNPAGASSAVIAFGLLNCGNDWWWAIDNIMVTGELNPELASNPYPPDEASDVSRKLVLSWTQGESVTGSPKHRIFLSEDFDDVNDSIGGITQDLNYYPTDGTLALDYGKTYYWRVDEAKTVTGWAQGSIWQFTVESFVYPISGTLVSATASSSNSANMGPGKTIDGSGLGDNDQHSIETDTMWLSNADGPQPTWIQYEFDKVYKLQEMWVWNYNMQFESVIGFGLKDVKIEYSTDGTDWATLSGVPQFTKAPGADTYTHDTTVTFGGAAAKYVKIIANSNWGSSDQYGLSEVRFFYIPVQARQPNPDNGATGAGPDVVLSWTAGREAATHEMYFSDDRKAVVNGTVAAVPMTESSYDAGTLDLGEIYFWRVDEVNQAETTTMWEGDVWRFATSEYLAVDDIESYGDANTPGQAGGYIWYTWIDGLGYSSPPPGVEGNGSGSSIGNWPPPVAEQDIVHSGMQSMPYNYNNSGSTGKFYYSEATANVDDLVIGPDWTRAGAKALTLYFYGVPENDANSTEQMYVKLNGAKIPYDGDMSDIREESWHTWNIELASFGVDLLNITEISIGFGNEGNKSVPGGSGVVYFDNIRLYPSRCVLSQRSADLAKVDYVEDCVVNFKEIDLMSEKWLITATAPSSGNLVGHWKFDGNANDSSGNGAHGTIGGDPTFVAGTVGSGALDFDGDDYVTIDGVVDYIPGNDITMSAWIKTTASGEGDWFSMNPLSGNQFLLCILNGDILFWEGGWQPAAGVTVNDGAWHHIAATRENMYVSIYVDGVYQSAGSYTSGVTFSEGDRWSIAQEWDGQTPSDFYTGSIDDVRIYNTSLAYEQVLHIAGIGIPGDLNDDNKVDLKDFAVLADAWLDEELWP